MRSNRGLVIKAMPMASICCSPPLQNPAFLFLIFLKWKKTVVNKFETFS